MWVRPVGLCLWFAFVSSAACELPGRSSGNKKSTFDKGLAPAPLHNQLVGTQHPSALGPLIWQVANKAPLDRVVVTAQDQIDQGKRIFEYGPTSYMIDYEGKENDLAAMAMLVEYATKDLNLYDVVYQENADDVSSALGFVTRRNWEKAREHTQRLGGYALGWRGRGAVANAQQPIPDDSRREIYVRIPDQANSAGLPRRAVIREVARINYRYMHFLHKRDGGSGPCGSDDGDNLNAIVRLIEPQASNLQDLRDIQETYDEVFEEIFERYQRLGESFPDPLQRADVFDGQSVKHPVQAVALLEDPDTVINGAQWVDDYLDYFQERYRKLPPDVLLFFAGSDLNRITGPATGELLRSVLISRLNKLQKRRPNVQIIPWLGSGGGPIRSGPGALVEMDGQLVFNEYDQRAKRHALLNVGIPRTVQADQLEAGMLQDYSGQRKQPTEEQMRKVLDASRSLVDGSALPKELTEEQEQVRLAWSAITMFTHIDRITRYAVPLSNLKTILERHNQVGRLKSGGGAGYTRPWPSVGPFVRDVLENPDIGFKPERWSRGDGTQLKNSLSLLLNTMQQRLEYVAAETVDLPGSAWTRLTSSTRAINDAFGRYILGTPFTTAHGIGATLRLLDKVPDFPEQYSTRNLAAYLVGDFHVANIEVGDLISVFRQSMGFGEGEWGQGGTGYGILYRQIPDEIRLLWRYYIRNDGFTIIRSSDENADRNLVYERISHAFPLDEHLSGLIKVLSQTELNINNYEGFIGYLTEEYRRDVLALEAFISGTYGGPGCKLYQECSEIDTEQARQYREALQHLLNNSDFRSELRAPVKVRPQADSPQDSGQNETWFQLFEEAIIPLLALPNWNRIG